MRKNRGNPTLGQICILVFGDRCRRSLSSRFSVGRLVPNRADDLDTCPVGGRGCGNGSVSGSVSDGQCILRLYQTHSKSLQIVGLQLQVIGCCATTFQMVALSLVLPSLSIRPPTLFAPECDLERGTSCDFRSSGQLRLQRNLRGQASCSPVTPWMHIRLCASDEAQEGRKCSPIAAATWRESHYR